MDYQVLPASELPRTDLSNVDAPVDVDVSNIGDELGTEAIAVKLWYFAEGEGMPRHVHTEQEELFYVLAGSFEVTLGGDETRNTSESTTKSTTEISAGAFWTASPDVPRGYTCTSEEGGQILAVGAPKDSDDESIQL